VKERREVNRKHRRKVERKAGRNETKRKEGRKIVSMFNVQHGVFSR